MIMAHCAPMLDHDKTNEKQLESKQASALHKHENEEKLISTRQDYGSGLNDS